MLGIPDVRQWFVDAQPYAVALAAGGAFLAYRGGMMFSSPGTTDGLLSLTGLGMMVLGGGGLAMENGFLKI